MIFIIYVFEEEERIFSKILSDYLVLKEYFSQLYGDKILEVSI
jgi:hypothetical protein